MKFKLNPFENSRTFFNPKGTNTTIVRDTFVNQIPIPQPEPVKETEPIVEEIVVDEPTLEITAEQPSPKNTRKKNERSTEN